MPSAENPPSPGSPAAEAHDDKPVEIEVNNKPVTMPSHEETAAAILAKAEVPADFTLYIKRGKELDEVPDGVTIQLHHGEKFVAVSGQDVS